MLNKVMIIGHLGKDPEIRTTQNGKKVATFNVATTEKFKDATGQRKESTEWHKVCVWMQLADIVEKYLKKGSKVYIEGKLQTRSWGDDNGQKRYMTEIIGKQMQMLDGKPGSQESSEKNPQEDLPF